MHENPPDAEAAANAAAFLRRSRRAISIVHSLFRKCWRSQCLPRCENALVSSQIGGAVTERSKNLSLLPNAQLALEMLVRIAEFRSASGPQTDMSSILTVRTLGRCKPVA